MSGVAHALDTFGRSLGLPRLHLDAGGTVALALDDENALLVLQDQSGEGDGVLLLTLHMGFPFAPMHATCAAALREADFRRQRHGPLQIGLQNQTLLATVRLSHHAVQPSTLDEALARLLDLMRDLRHGQ